MATIHSLPLDLLDKVFEFPHSYHSYSSLTSFALVCRDWRTPAQSRTSVRRLGSLPQGVVVTPLAISSSEVSSPDFPNCATLVQAPASRRST